ncbi:MAG TPA: hypothetical protein VJN69_14740 [Candidatus Acidoferrales bacterium]|nr:hypothetical protein [Candidatus Acidoferrales bacterium]
MEKPVIKSKIIKVLIIALGLAAVCIAVDSWLTVKDAQRQLTNAFANEQNLIAQSDATKRQQEDDLKNLLSVIESLKAKIRTPSQVIKELPKYLPLPAPISVARQRDGSLGQAQGTGSARLRPEKAKNWTGLPDFRYETSVAPKLRSSSVRDYGVAAKIPVEDLKPLFDFAQDCRACEAELEAAQKTAADDSVKIKALTRERDLAVHAEKGTLWHRMRQDMVWFAFGMAGYAVINR